MSADRFPRRAQLGPEGELTLPEEVREALLIGPGDEVSFELIAPGVVKMLATKRIPDGQAWFWTEEWQAGEREASEELARGEGTVHSCAEEMFNALGIE